MKIGRDRSIHLTYCTNIHPGETWADTLAQLKYYLPALKSRLCSQQAFGIGLRLSDLAARELLAQDELQHFQRWLDQEELYVFTLNGFPYGGFHRQVVKDQVYAPDWAQQERLDYTLRLAHILAVLLPPGLEGGISTVPLSYKPWLTPEATIGVFKRSTLQIAQCVAELIRLREETGKLIHLDLEPEPDGLLENAAEVIAYFQNWLLPTGGAFLSKLLNKSLDQAETLLREHVRLCYDACHFAIAYENPAIVAQQLQAAGIQIGKLQLSAALQVRLPDSLSARQQLSDRLSAFVDTTYLHQVIERHANGQIHQYRDLGLALPHLLQTPAKEWRIHFHVPLFLQDYQSLQSTQSDLQHLLQLVPATYPCHHLEIETYTWEVLPPDLQLPLLSSIQREYEWVLRHLSHLEQI